MSTRVYLFALWCLIVLSGFSVAAYYAWSPFGDEDSGGGGAYVRGPHHK